MHRFLFRFAYTLLKRLDQLPEVCIGRVGTRARTRVRTKVRDRPRARLEFG